MSNELYALRHSSFEAAAGPLQKARDMIARSSSELTASGQLKASDLLNQWAGLDASHAELQKPIAWLRSQAVQGAPTEAPPAEQPEAQLESLSAAEQAEISSAAAEPKQPAEAEPEQPAEPTPEQPAEQPTAAIPEQPAMPAPSASLAEHLAAQGLDPTTFLQGQQLQADSSVASPEPDDLPRREYTRALHSAQQQLGQAWRLYDELKR